MSSRELTAAPPWNERPRFWWALFVSGTIAILAFVPYANTIWKSLRDQVGAQGLRWALIGLVAVLTAGVLRRIARHGVTPRMLVVPAVMALWMANMSVTAEAFHLVEYGLLGAVAFRALGFHLEGWRVYVAAALLTASVGVLDEVVQWLTPRRFWDLRDVGFNAAGGVLAQIWIALARGGRDRHDGRATNTRVE